MSIVKYIAVGTNVMLNNVTLFVTLLLYIARPSKHAATTSGLISSYTRAQPIPTCLHVCHARICSHVIIIHHHHHLYHFFFSKTAILLPELVETLIFSLNVSNIDRGVHGHQEIILLLPYISTVDRGPPCEQPLNDAI